MTTDKKNNSTPSDVDVSLPRTLFSHLPKSGGTTLDSIFCDHYFAFPLVRNLQFTSDISLFSKIINRGQAMNLKFRIATLIGQESFVRIERELNQSKSDSRELGVTLGNIHQKSNFTLIAFCPSPYAKKHLAN